MRRLPLLILAVLALAAIARDKWAEEAHLRKADYIYLEAQNRDVEGEKDAAYELLREARLLSPSDKSIGFDLAIYLLEMEGNDSTVFADAVRMLEEYYRSNPEDFYGALSYGSMLEYQNRNEEAVGVWETLHRYHPDNIQVTFKLASSLENLLDTAAVRRAIALYDTVTALESAPAQLVVHQMQLLYRLGDTLAIVKRMEDILDEPGGRNSENLVMAGNVHLALDHYDMAEQLLKEACETDSTSGIASYALANFYLNTGDSVEYEKEIYNALTRQALDVDVKHDLLASYVATHLQDSLMQPRINQLFGVLVEQYPHDSRVRGTFGDYLAMNGQYAEAAEQMRYSLDADPSQNARWTALCELYEMDGKYDRAVATATDAMRYYPADPMLYYVRAFANMNLENNDSSIADIKKGLAVNDSSASYSPKAEVLLLTFMGDVYHRMGRKDESFASYDKALEKDPDNALALNNYAYYLSVEGERLDDARKMAERSLMIEPNSVNTVDTYAWVMYRMGDYKRAKEIFDSAIDEMLSEENESGEAYLHAGDIYFMAGEPEQAMEFWKKGLQLEPDNETLKQRVETGSVEQ